MKGFWEPRAVPLRKVRDLYGGVGQVCQFFGPSPKPVKRVLGRGGGEGG